MSRGQAHPLSHTSLPSSPCHSKFLLLWEQDQVLQTEQTCFYEWVKFQKCVFVCVGVGCTCIVYAWMHTDEHMLWGIVVSLRYIHLSPYANMPLWILAVIFR